VLQRSRGKARKGKQPADREALVHLVNRFLPERSDQKALMVSVKQGSAAIKTVGVSTEMNVS
jgi:hypothetical protein